MISPDFPQKLAIGVYPREYRYQPQKQSLGGIEPPRKLLEIPLF